MGCSAEVSRGQDQLVAQRASCWKTLLVREDFDGVHVWGKEKLSSQAAQKVCPARPQRVKTGGVPSGAHGATNKEHQVCARRRVVRLPGPR